MFSKSQENHCHSLDGSVQRTKMQVLVLRVASLGFMDLLFNRQTYPSLLFDNYEEYSMKKVVLCLSVGLVLLTLNADSVLTNRAGKDGERREGVSGEVLCDSRSYRGCVGACVRRS